MFRKMRRFKQQLSNEECIEILKEEPRGVLSLLGDDDYPYGFPMDFYYDEEENKLYFHCAKVGHKIDALRRHDKASFCVYDEGYTKENDWALNIRSVILFGRIKPCEDTEICLDKLRHLARRYYPTKESAEKEIEKSFKNVCMLEFCVEHMTGKLVNES